MVIVSDETPEDTGFNLENYIAQISVEAIADAEESTFFNGDRKENQMVLSIRRMLVALPLKAEVSV